MSGNDIPLFKYMTFRWVIWFVCCSDIPKNDGYSKYLKFVTPFCYFLTSLNPPSPSAPPCNELKMPIPGAARSAAARLLGLRVRIPPVAWMSVCCECCVLSGSGLCVGLIARSEESYRLWCVVVCDLETRTVRRPWPKAMKGCNALKLIKFDYDASC